MGLTISVLMGLILLGQSPVLAEQLPIRTYTTADGLARDGVYKIMRDSRGLLWFCTGEGLSRFDGYRFKNYTPADGLPHWVVRDIIESRDGAYYLATNDGVCRFDPAGPPAFTVYRTESEKARRCLLLYEDGDGTIWCGTEAGLYRLETAGDDRALRHVEVRGVGQFLDTIINAIVQDPAGSLWVGAASGLYRVRPDGQAERYTTEHGLPANSISKLLVDRKGRLWAGTLGLCVISLAGSPRPSVERIYNAKDGLPNLSIRALIEGSDGKLWVGTPYGLCRITPDVTEGERSVTVFDTSHGLTSGFVMALAEDRDGNLWAGTETLGVMKITRAGFISFGAADGFGRVRIASIFEDQTGRLCLFAHAEKGRQFWVYDGGRFANIQPRSTRNVSHWSWGVSKSSFQDSRGEWWVATGQGLYRYPRAKNIEQLAHLSPKAIYTRRDGLGSDEIFQLMEDSRGDVWISTLGSQASPLARWERATEKIYPYTIEETSPFSGATTLFEDASGNVWIGLYRWSGLYPNWLARYRDGRFTLFSEDDGLPGGYINGLYQDRAGRLWLVTNRSGLVRVNDAESDHPHFTNLTTADGLASHDVRGITEDQWGRLYLATGRGLDRYDPATGRIKHYTKADGILSNELIAAYRDRAGALWFGSVEGGVTRLIPQPDPPAKAPPVFINGLRIAGDAYPLSELGETDIANVSLGPDQRQIEIDFFAVSLAAGETLRYQYKLEGSDRDWSAPTDQRTVSLRLSPGSYRLLVRAISSEGSASEAPATLAFTIARPVWQRWWFILSAVFLAVLVAYLAYRYRVGRLIEIERVRTRIATDLHDDIGASLSRMAILSEVVKQQSPAGSQHSSGMLTEIADSARGLVDSMSDIVWSIDPRKDDLRNVAQRVRQFASDVLEAKGIRWEFETPDDIEKIKLPPEQRRHLFLIFKEAVNNVARHSGCNSAWLSLSLAHNRLVAEVRDDGRGLPAEMNYNGRGGNGLKNMKARAAELGGSLAIDSPPDGGTRLTLVVPLKQSRRRKAKGAGA